MSFWKISINLFVAGVIILLGMIYLGLVDFPSSVRPDLNKIAAGCYSHDEKIFIFVNRNGEIVFNDFLADYHIQVIKNNYLLVPSYNILYDEESNKLIKTNKSPYFFKYTDSKMNEFEVITSQGNFDVIFSKSNGKNCKELELR